MKRFAYKRGALVRRLLRCGLPLWALAAPSAWAAAPTAVPLGADRAGLHAPARVAADAGGRLFVAEPAAGRVVVFDPFGRVSAVHAGFDQPLAVAVDGHGRIYVSELGLGCVNVFDTQWHLLRKLGNGNGEFRLPGFVAPAPVTGGDAVVVSDAAVNQLRVYTNGALAFAFGAPGTGNGEFDFPAGVAVGTNAIYVVDQNNDRVEIFNRAGMYLSQFSLVTRVAPGMLGFAGGRSQGLVLDRANRLYVVDAYQGFLRVFDTAGNFLGGIGQFGEGPGELRSPADAVIDPFNRLCIASPNNGRVERYGLDAYYHLTASSVDSALATGTNLVLSVTAGGGGASTFQWQLGTNALANVGNVSGATGEVLTISALTPSNAGEYAVSISGPGLSITSAPTALAVLAAPAIDGSPEGRTVAQGADASLTCTAHGDALAFQWLHDGYAIPGATNVTLTLTGVQPNDGGRYAVTAQNPVGSATSAAAELRVLRPPGIVLQPIDRRAIRGDTAGFEVAAEGDALAYQWRFEGTNLPDGGDASVVLPDVQPSAAGRYTVVVTNPVGAVTSAVAHLQVLIPPALCAITNLATRADSNLLVQSVGDAGARFAVESSDNLLDWTKRTATNPPVGPFDYVDPTSASETQLFYRLHWEP